MKGNKADQACSVFAALRNLIRSFPYSHTFGDDGCFLAYRLLNFFQ